MYLVLVIWPTLIACVYALRSAHAALTPSHYLRLAALALTAILPTTPVGILAVVLNLTATPVSPWRSLADPHFDFSRVEEIPALLWRNARAGGSGSDGQGGARLVKVGVEFTRWMAPLTAPVFFGFAVEARKHYAFALGAVLLQGGGVCCPCPNIRRGSPTKGSNKEATVKPDTGPGPESTGFPAELFRGVECNSKVRTIRCRVLVCIVLEQELIEQEGIRVLHRGSS
ncbi:hypothetical protein DFH06DRAFT_1370815 [Mycena polygramma]|nr:hypothetical protein DFH06DRAFT_1370815 [Mycena polygramma]